MPLIKFGDSMDGPLFLRPDDIFCHWLICGQTGSGKSKLLEQIFRQLIRFGISFALIDPKNDTADDTIAWIAEEHERDALSPLTIRKLIVLDDNFAVDPLHVPDTITGLEYERRLESCIDWLARSCARIDHQPDFSQMPRRHRHSKNFLWMQGVRRGTKKPLGFGNILKSLQLIGTEAWDRIFEDTVRYLPEDIANDLRWLRSLPARDRAFFLDSSISGFRKILSPATLPIFAGRAKPISFQEIIARGQIVLCRFGERTGYSPEFGRVLGHIVFGGLLQAAAIVRPKTPYFIAVEEANLVLGPDLLDGLRRARAFNLFIIVLGQSLSCFEESE